jgi:hypothetical protein
VGEYELAHWWANLANRPIGPERTTDDELAELAALAVLARRITRRVPLTAHQALRSGATVDAVVAAAGMEPAELYRGWREWADGQRDRRTGADDGTPIGLDQAEYDQVHAVLLAELPTGTAAVRG